MARALVYLGVIVGMAGPFGLQCGESDPGWWVIRGLHKIGWVTRGGLPRETVQREDIAYAG